MSRTWLGGSGDGAIGGVAKRLFGAPSSSPMSTDGRGIYEQVIGAFFKGQDASDRQRSSTVKPIFNLVEGRLPKVCSFVTMPW